ETHRVNATHHAHRELRQQEATFEKAIMDAKKKHWTDFLEEATDEDLWTAHQYLK
ncbi:hypothetical protein BDQ17DRAFT_1201767, partial [Cyathus striatus]